MRRNKSSMSNELLEFSKNDPIFGKNAYSARYGKCYAIAYEEKKIYLEKVKRENLILIKGCGTDANGNYMYKKTRILNYFLLFALIFGSISTIVLACLNIMEWWWSLLFPTIVLFLMFVIKFLQVKSYERFVSNPDNGLLESYLAYLDYRERSEDRQAKSGTRRQPGISTWDVDRIFDS